MTATSLPTGSAAPDCTWTVRRSWPLEPDLSLWEGGRCHFVGDVKYKRDTGGGHNDDVYQLLAYATALGLTDATLVFAPTRPGSNDRPEPRDGVRSWHLRASGLNQPRSPPTLIPPDRLRPYHSMKPTPAAKV